MLLDIWINSCYAGLLAFDLIQMLNITFLLPPCLTWSFWYLIVWYSNCCHEIVVFFYVHLVSCARGLINVKVANLKEMNSVLWKKSNESNLGRSHNDPRCQEIWKVVGTRTTGIPLTQLIWMIKAVQVAIYNSIIYFFFFLLPWLCFSFDGKKFFHVQLWSHLSRKDVKFLKLNIFAPR